MLDMDWEPIATQLVNTPDDELLETVIKLIRERAPYWALFRRTSTNSSEGASPPAATLDSLTQLCGEANSRPTHERAALPEECVCGEPAGVPGKPILIVGRDTRPSSPQLAKLVIAAGEALGAHVMDYGICTTPQLHWCVGETNKRIKLNRANMSLETDAPRLCQYIKELTSAFAKIRQNSLAGTFMKEGDTLSSNGMLGLPSLFILDCADGVGGIAAERLIQALQSVQANHNSNDDTYSSDAKEVCVSPVAPTSFWIVNDGQDEKAPSHINLECGAEFVQKGKQLPRGIQPAMLLSPSRFKSIDAHAQILAAAIDGDADRIVFFYLKQTEDSKYVFRLLDGDKIMTLCAMYISKLLTTARLATALRMGVVQTAYANGASTQYMTDKLGLRVEWACTGVKYLHACAEKAFDIGIYFEANGHGTVLFNERAKESIRYALATESRSTRPEPERVRALKQLIALQHLINPYIGDALSDWLLVAAALNQVIAPALLTQQITNHAQLIELWDSLYEDFPSKMDKVVVPDRNAIKVTNAERTCVEPHGLQAEIDRAVEEIQKESNTTPARSFVRPSGTEDIVRVFAEAATQELADELCEKVKALVVQFCK